MQIPLIDETYKINRKFHISFLRITGHYREVQGTSISDPDLRRKGFD